MNKIKVLVIVLLLFSIFTTTYCAFTVAVSKTGSITTTELSTTFIDNESFLAKVQQFDPTITSINKYYDLTRLNSPIVAFTSDNIVSTPDSSVPIFLAVDNGTVYYYTSAINIDFNSN